MWRLLGARGERSLPRAGEAAGLARPGRDAGRRHAEGGDRPVGSLPWGPEGIRVPVQARTIWVRVSRAGHVMTMVAKQLPRVGGALAPSVLGPEGCFPQPCLSSALCRDRPRCVRPGRAPAADPGHSVLLS